MEEPLSISENRGGATRAKERMGRRKERPHRRNRPVTAAILLVVLALAFSPAGVRSQTTDPPAPAAPTFSTTPLKGARQMHGAAVLGDYLYVLGGAIEVIGYTNAVEFARINADGTLGEWNDTTGMPTPRAYISNSTLALNDILYVVGGLDNKVVASKESEQAAKSNTVYWSRPGADGQLGPWQESPPWPGIGMECLTVVATPGHIHVLGGYNAGKAPQATVFSGVIDDQGALVRWEEGPPLPVPLWFHNSAAVGGRVWVWGGLTTSVNSSTSSRVFSSGIMGDGKLGPWREEMTTLPVAFFSAASASAGDYLLSFAPRMNGGATTSDIWFSRFQGGQLSPWQRLTTEMKVTLYMTAAPDYRRGNIYIPSGRLGPRLGWDKTVYFYHLTGAATRDAEGADAAVAPTATATGGMAATATPQRFAFQAAASLSGDAVPGFLSYDQARAAAAGPPAKPLLLYFHSAAVRDCLKQKALLQTPDFAPLASQAAFAWMDLNDYPQLVIQLGIFRVPTWVLYDARGNAVGQVYTALTAAQLAQSIAAAR